jgi:hypothetical protein
MFLLNQIMKKKLFIGLAAVAVAAVVAVNVNFALQDNVLSALSLVNVEMLAHGETPSGCSSCKLVWEGLFGKGECSAECCTGLQAICEDKSCKCTIVA